MHYFRHWHEDAPQDAACGLVFTIPVFYNGVTQEAIDEVMADLEPGEHLEILARDSDDFIHVWRDK